jgi:hypothetical protein
VRAFRAVQPCPATGLHRGACPGWHVDHIEPLCAGGAEWITVQDHRFKTFVDVRECRRRPAAVSENPQDSTKPIQP